LSAVALAKADSLNQKHFGLTSRKYSEYSDLRKPKEY